MVRVSNQACNKVGIGFNPDNTMILSSLPETKELGVSDIDLAQLEVYLEDSK